jgi:hypothetical protein
LKERREGEGGGLSSPRLKKFKVLNFERDERGVRGLGLPLSTIRELKSFKL